MAGPQETHLGEDLKLKFKMDDTWGGASESTNMTLGESEAPTSADLGKCEWPLLVHLECEVTRAHAEKWKQV